MRKIRKMKAMENVDATEAARGFGKIVTKCLQGHSFRVTRKGGAEVAILAWDDYQNLLAAKAVADGEGQGRREPAP